VPKPGRGVRANWTPSNGNRIVVKVRTGWPSLVAGWKRQWRAASMDASLMSGRTPRSTRMSSGIPVWETSTRRITTPRTRAFSAASGYRGMTISIGFGGVSTLPGATKIEGVLVRVGVGVRVNDGVSVDVAVKVGEAVNVRV
jgi:hypothetical protein